MSILADENTRLLVQGITGTEGRFHTEKMIGYGTRVAAGVTPGKGGQSVLGVPVFDTVEEAVRATGANASIIFVPPALAADAIGEAAMSVPLVVAITEGIPVREMAGVKALVQERGVSLIGPNCPGLISPGKAKLGIMPGDIHQQGPVAVISRSGTLTYEVVFQLSAQGLGQSTCVGIGGDPIVGLGFIEVLGLLAADPQTEAVVLVGEIGGQAEEQAARFIAAGFDKPVFAFIAGRTAPPGRRMGHAGAIVSGASGNAETKIMALREAGITVVEDLGRLGLAVSQGLGG